jgi:hypothetical protein
MFRPSLRWDPNAVPSERERVNPQAKENMRLEPIKQIKLSPSEAEHLRRLYVNAGVNVPLELLRGVTLERPQYLQYLESLVGSVSYGQSVWVSDNFSVIEVWETSNIVTSEEIDKLLPALLDRTVEGWVENPKREMRWRNQSVQLL